MVCCIPCSLQAVRGCKHDIQRTSGAAATHAVSTFMRNCTRLASTVSASHAARSVDGPGAVSASMSGRRSRSCLVAAALWLAAASTDCTSQRCHSLVVGFQPRLNDVATLVTDRDRIPMAV